MAIEFKKYTEYIKQKNLKLTVQREQILNSFMKAGKHLSVEDLYDIVKEKDPNVGFATVFRTLKLLKEAGIAKEVDFEDKKKRYELCSPDEHHDHMICVRCGEVIEAYDPKLEKLQKKLCKRYNFLPQRHRMEIYGICSKCGKKYR